MRQVLCMLIKAGHPGALELVGVNARPRATLSSSRSAS